MQYECEEILVEFRTSSHPSWSRWQGADTVSHVVLWWHGSCFRELRYPQKARQHRHLHQDFDVKARLCIYRYGDAARTHARYIQRHAHASTPTYVQIIKKKLICWFFYSPTKPYIDFKSSRCPETNTYAYIHIYTQIYKRYQVNLRITFTWMVLASMHIDGPWRSCFLSVLRHIQTYV